MQGEQEKGEKQKKQKNLSDGVRYSSESSDKLINKNQKKSHNLKNFVPTIKNSLKIALFGAGFGIVLFLDLSRVKAADAATNLAIAPSIFTQGNPEQNSRRIAREVIENIAPVIRDDRQSENDFNADFTNDGYLSKPLIAETQITKDPPRIIRTNNNSKPVIRSTSSKTASISGEVVANRFPFGYCTYYVSQKRFIPWSGNAIAWLSGARAYGYATGDVPQVGAIAVTTEGGATGHVAMVDAVNSDGTITLSEMNYNGFGVISSRTISASYGAIRGYIY